MSEERNIDPLFFFGASETATLGRTLDWSTSPLGPPDAWPSELRIILGMLLSNRQPVCLFWGPDHLYFYNDGYIPILGSKKHPFAFGQKGEVVWKEIWPQLYPQIEQVMEGGASTWHEDQCLPIYGDEGTLREAYFTYSYSPVFLNDGKISGVIVTCSETTKKVEAEKALHQSNLENIEILESMSDAFFTLSSEWIVERVNVQFERALGLSREDVIGMSIRDLFFNTPELKESHYVRILSQAFKDREPVSFVEYYGPTDMWMAVNVQSRPKGGLAVFFKNISEEKRNAKILQDAVSVRDDFMAIASHELKTPITSLKLHSQLFKRRLEKSKDVDQPSLIAYANQVEAQTSRLGRLIDDMLDISRIKTGRMTIIKENFDLCELIKNILNKMGPQFKWAGYELPLFEDCLGAIGNWDILRIEQVVTNLLTNALRYGQQKQVLIRVSANSSTVHLEVRDQGIGISKTNHDSIFNRFHRVSEIAEASGLGIGLFLARQIVEAHSGKIWVESELNLGSVFHVEIPRT